MLLEVKNSQEEQGIWIDHVEGSITSFVENVRRFIDKTSVDSITFKATAVVMYHVLWCVVTVRTIRRTSSVIVF